MKLAKRFVDRPGHIQEFVVALKEMPLLGRHVQYPVPIVLTKQNGNCIRRPKRFRIARLREIVKSVGWPLEDYVLINGLSAADRPKDIEFNNKNILIHWDVTTIKRDLEIRTLRSTSARHSAALAGRRRRQTKFQQVTLAATSPQSF
ncbi:MAG TPA: hypothetical protein VN989_11630 [Casimicrobiaceae bacterium]|nr:hypothetical protein [Casimicrobiaceae bacterium]